jgi:hypothetical protein
VDITVTNSGSTCTSTGANLVQQMISCSTGSGLNPTGSSTLNSYSVSLTLPLFSLTQFTTGGAINVRTAAIVGGTQSIFGVNSSALALTGIPGQVTVKVAAHAARAWTPRC